MTSHERLDDADLDRMIRQALREDLGDPPDEVWQRIRSQVAAGPSPRPRPPAHSLSQLLAPLVQGLMATAVLLLLGISLGPSLWWQSYQFGASDQVVSITPRVAPLSQPAVVAAPETEALLLRANSEDILSEGALRQYQEMAATENTDAMVQASTPELDPVLANRHELRYASEDPVGNSVSSVLIEIPERAGSYPVTTR